MGAMPELMSSRDCVILGDQRKAGQAQVTLAFKERKEHFAQFIYAVRLGIHWFLPP